MPPIRKRLAFPLLLVTCGLSGCFGITDTIRESRDESRAVQKGTVIEMPLFSATVPDKLVVNRDDPRPGFLSLRYPFKGNGSYNVYPLEVAGPEPDIKRAWLAYLEKAGQASYVRRMRIVVERPIKWSGLNAWYHQLCFEASGDETGNAVVGLIVQKEGHLFHINRSIPILTDCESSSKTMERADDDYERFLQGVTLR